MVRKLRISDGIAKVRLGRVAGKVTIVVAICLSLAPLLPAQSMVACRCPHGVVTPGAIGSQQLQRGGPLNDDCESNCIALQTVEIRGPRGVAISMAAEGRFERLQATPRRVGMLVGPLYRIRVANIPFSPGVEVFPTIEIVDRVYAPAGCELRFPIPVELTAEDLQMAADGKFITRVIYVEDPHTAVPTADDAEHQSWFDVGPGQNPLAVARGLGRPVAVLRLGGRVPQAGDNLDMTFLCGCPPFMDYGPAETPGPNPAPKKQFQPPIQPVTPEQGMQRSQWPDEFIARRPINTPVNSPMHTTAAPPTALPPVNTMSPADSFPADTDKTQTPNNPIIPTPNGVKTLPPPPTGPRF